MHRSLSIALLVALLAGCASETDPREDGDADDDSAGDGFREGVVFFEDRFTAASGQPDTFTVTVEAGARDLVLEGCGGVTTRASAAWEEYPLCDAPASGPRQLTVSLPPGTVGTGTGRLLLRADLPAQG